MKPTHFIAAAALAASWASPSLSAASNISANHSFSYGANIGWLEWRPSATDGVTLGELYLSGKIWSANCGWIDLGSGSPANGYRYQNNSATDFGVNLNPDGTLEGYAYGANIGWIRFTKTTASGPLDPDQVARFDFKTGIFHGYAYGANIGWIDLGNNSSYVKATTIEFGSDADGDSIPDNWEKQYTGGTSVLTGSGDYDGDGLTDLEEYLANTDPTNPNDYLRVTHIASTGNGTSLSLTWNSSPSRCYQIEKRPDLFTGSWELNEGPGYLAPDPGVSTTHSFPQPAAEQGYYRVQAFVPVGNFGP